MKNFRSYDYSNGRTAMADSPLVSLNYPRLITYVKNQRAHHQKNTFQEEYLELLEKHGVDYDERYVWG